MTDLIPDVGDLWALRTSFYVDAAKTHLGDPTGVSLTIRDPDGVLLTVTPARESLGVYVYNWSPLVGGVHTVTWTGSGAVQVVDEYGVEVRDATPSPADLIDLQTLRSFMRMPTADDDQDAVLGLLITSVSSYICEAYQQEFAPATSVASARDFAWRGGAFIDLAPYNAQSGSITDIEIDTDGGAATALVEFTDYTEHPSVSPWGTIDYLRLPTLCLYQAPVGLAHRNWRRVTVTAKWGYPTVPPIVAQAACWTVVHWHRKYVGSRPSSFAEVPEDVGVREYAMPYPAVQLMRSFENRSMFVA